MNTAVPKPLNPPHDKHLQYPADHPSAATTRCKRDAQPDTRPRGISAHSGVNGLRPTATPPEPGHPPHARTRPHQQKGSPPSTKDGRHDGTEQLGDRSSHRKRHSAPNPQKPPATPAGPSHSNCSCPSRSPKNSRKPAIPANKPNPQ
ncbi:hypothetical protein VZT92_022986 [Zoarces viviparus]|uniref:Uncharacterized protein n=1 Tax=Zoarces viviparus TaxID=48416 RepID=A0AAW1E545_ZOAVI